MAFATASRTSQLFTTAATSYTVTLPAVNSGDLILVCAATRVGTTDISGYTLILAHGNPGFGFAAVFAKISDGTETTAVVTNNSSGVCAAIVYKVSGWGGSITNDIDYAGGSSLSSTSPSVGVTAGWGADDNLVLSFCGAGDDSVTFTSFPSGFTDTFQIQTDTGRDASIAVASCQRQITAGSITVGSYTLAEMEQIGTVSLIIKPGTSGGGATGPNTPINPSITSLLATSARLNWEQG